MMTEYTLRNATNEDIDLSFEMRKNAMYEYIAESKGWDEEKEMQDHINDFNTEVMQIIEVDNKPVGVVERVFEDGNFYVHGLYILAEFQNYKIGFQVMNNIINTAITEKRDILLQVLKVNTKAKAFYDKLGFKVYNETDHHFHMIYKFSDI
jgi:ribosomal protein S18 acetylase RimI-like enzyme